MSEPPDNNIIELRDVEKIYRVGTEIVRALRGVSLVIGDNEYLARTDGLGQFELDCPPESEFPIEFQLRKGTWCPAGITFHTQQLMDWGATSTRASRVPPSGDAVWP